jgi:hypothetical protein
MTTGYFTQSTSQVALGNTVVYLETPPLEAGSYYVNGTALVTVGPFNEIGIECWQNVVGEPGYVPGGFGGPGQFGVIGTVQVWDVRVGESIQLVCYSNGGSGDYVDNGSLSAILIDNSAFAAETRLSSRARANDRGAPK